MKHYLIYKTTNILNNKFYVGQHVTEDINDTYLGSGTLLNKDIKKYGRKFFKREILFELQNQEELDKKEKEIVDKKFIRRNDTYNLIEGGYFGLDHVNKDGIDFHIIGGQKTKQNYLKLSKEQKELYNKTYRQKCIKKIQNNKELFCLKIKNGLNEYRKTHPEFGKHFLGKNLSEQHIQKIKDSSIKINRNGSKNPMYNKIWIFNENTGQNIIWDKDKLIPYGWIIYKCNDFKKYKKNKEHIQIINDIKYRRKIKYINKLYQIYNWYKKHGYRSVVKQFNIKITRQTLLFNFKKHLDK